MERDETNAQIIEICETTVAAKSNRDSGEVDAKPTSLSTTWQTKRQNGQTREYRILNNFKK